MPKIQMRRDSAANWKSVNPILLVGEWALETDTKKMKIGDGSTAYNSLPYSTVQDSDEWQKPADWVDIRSAALQNSIYFLVGHSADYAAYPTFPIKATVSNSGTYDVFVDGVKQVTTASSSITTLNWQTLALTSGWDVTYPTALRTHIVRVTPSVSTNTITAIQIKDGTDLGKGLLWAHFTLTNAISLQSFSNQSWLEAVTSSQESIKITGSSGLSGAFSHDSKLACVPAFDGNNETISLNTMFGLDSGYTIDRQRNNALKTVAFKNIKSTNATNLFSGYTALKEIKTENCLIEYGRGILGRCYALEKIPSFSFANSTRCDNAVLENEKLTNTVIDATDGKNITSLGIYATAEHRADGMKGLTVSNEAPFDNATSPQLNVSYTGMSRAALVNLFKSMPYNVGYTVVGTPTIVDGVASGFSSSDYVQATSILPDNIDTFELCIKYDNIAADNRLFRLGTASDTAYSLQTLSNKRIAWYGDDIIFISDKNVDDYTYVKVNTTNGLNSNVQIQVSNDGNSWETSTITTNTGNTTVRNSTPIFGRIVSGSIDLNHTYIKVNGVTWFNGKAAMTKTCSVVGCTGTADLTADDKAIATGKGWKLTVA